MHILLITYQIKHLNPKLNYLLKRNVNVRILKNDFNARVYRCTMKKKQTHAKYFPSKKK